MSAVVREDEAFADVEARVLEILREHNPEDLAETLTEEEKVELAVKLLADEDLAYSKDPWLWLTEQVITQDEATLQTLRWPAEKVYLQEALHALRTEPKLCIPKSRRVLATWLVAAYCTWKTRYYRNAAIYWQSETEEKAAFVLEKRCAFIEENLVQPYLRRRYRAIRTTSGLIGRMTYEQTESYLLAVPQGGNVVRTYTPTIFVSDEIEFQKDGHAAVTAILPTIEEGKAAQLILLSSSNGPGGVIAGICEEIGFRKFERAA